jgi:hypothetical protein
MRLFWMKLAVFVFGSPLQLVKPNVHDKHAFQMAMQVADSLFNQLTFLLRVLQRLAETRLLLQNVPTPTPPQSGNVQEVDVQLLCSFKFM